MKAIKKAGWKNWLVIIVLLIFSLGIRLYKLPEIPLYPDEITWMVRGRETALAVRTLNFKFFETAWWNIKGDTEAIAIPLTVLTGVPQIYLARDASVLSFNLFKDYMVGRWVVIIISSVFISVFYLFSKIAFNSKVVFLASLFLALDPIFVANNQLIMNDSLLTIFMFLSMGFYVLTKNQKLSMIFSSLFAALAFLTKPTALILFAVYFVSIIFTPNNFKKGVIKLVITGILTFLIISGLFPSSWSNFWGAIPEYLLRQKEFVGEGINAYFMGRVTNNPPFYYYLFELVTRTPLVVIIGFMGFLLTLFGKDARKKQAYVFNLVSLVFIIFYLFLMGISAKKLGVRYILPVWPFIYLFFAQGIMMALNRLKKSWQKVLLIIVLLGSVVFGLFRFFPNLSVYYNFLIGKPQNVRRLDLVGLCTGVKPAVDYVLTCYPEATQIAALGCGRSTIPYYYPHSFNYNWKEEKIVVAEAYYLQLDKDPEFTQFFLDNAPTQTFKAGGIDLSYLWVMGDLKSNCEPNPKVR